MGFARQAAGTYLVRIALLPIGALNAVIVARWLGPGGQGLYAAVGAYVATTGMLAGLGLSAAVTRAAAADPRTAPALVANARLFGAGLGLAAAVGLMAAREAFPSAFGGIPVSLLAVAAAALPFSLAAAQLQAIVLGLRRVRQFNLAEAVDRWMLLAAGLVVLVLLDRGVLWLLAATTLAAVFRVVFLQFLLSPASARWRPDPALAGSLRGVSGRAYVTMLLSFLVLKVDIVLLQNLCGAYQTGQYAVGVQVAELMLVLPGAVGTVLFPRVASEGRASNAPFTAKATRHAVAVVSVGCAAAAALAPVLIPAIFGEAYRDAVPALWALLPGIWCLSVQMVLANDLAGRDYPAFLALVWALALAVNVGLNLWWIPRIGIVGAAAASSVAYALALALVAGYWLRRFPDVRARELVVVGPDESRAMPRALIGLFRTRRPGSSDGERP